MWFFDFNKFAIKSIYDFICVNCYSIYVWPSNQYQISKLTLDYPVENYDNNYEHKHWLAKYHPYLYWKYVLQKQGMSL